MRLSSLKMIADALITGAKLAASTITGSNLANSTIDSQHITSGSVDGAHLSTDAKTTVLASKILLGMTQTDNFATANATSDNFGTTLQAAVQSGALGGTESQVGVAFEAASNRCKFWDSTTNNAIQDASGRDAYGRITDVIQALTGTTGWTNGLNTLTGVGTAFNTQLAANDLLIAPNGAIVRVASVTSDVAATLSAVYAGATISGQSTTRHRVTISYYIDAAGTETAFTMPASTTVDVQFPEFFTLSSLPARTLVNNGATWLDVGSAGADHNHDSRYFTETELGAITAPTGASRIGLDVTSIVGASSTTVQGALQQIALRPVYESKTIITQNTVPDLTYTPRVVSSVVMIYQGLAQEYGASYDYTVAGKVVTWNSVNAGFNLDIGDRVWFKYMASD